MSPLPPAPPPSPPSPPAGGGLAREALVAGLEALDTPEVLALCQRFSRQTERLALYLEVLRRRTGSRAQLAAALVCFDLARQGAPAAQRELTALLPTLRELARDVRLVGTLLGEDPYLVRLWDDVVETLVQADPREGLAELEAELEAAARAASGTGGLPELELLSAEELAGTGELLDLDALALPAPELAPPAGAGAAEVAGVAAGVEARAAAEEPWEELVVSEEEAAPAPPRAPAAPAAPAPARAAPAAPARAAPAAPVPPRAASARAAPAPSGTPARGDEAARGARRESSRAAVQQGVEGHMEAARAAGSAPFATASAEDLERLERLLHRAASHAAALPAAAGLASLGHLFLAAHLRRHGLFGRVNARRASALRTGLAALPAAGEAVDAAHLFELGGPLGEAGMARVAELLLDFTRFCAATGRDPRAPATVEAYVAADREPEPALSPSPGERRRGSARR